ncbi:MAG: glycosyl hydrolase 53 family protein [Bacteroidales bacterium]|nr:glycosyl hydrolase 53 family protein [Lachnoclostridium sp.]MCM1383252.1 glycosyl hydrolase 53 family protein [Lachnoclostridium sp.]MCM1465740.1 glycosyl hydrolase 53 family protein [Bacteroidales bacterium]
MALSEFIKGMDVSSLMEERACGAKYYDGGKEESALSILKRYGADSLRIRLWNDPYSSSGNPHRKPYGGGTNDFDKLVKLAEEGRKLGYSYLLDFQYSDFWADPGKQFPPKAWKHYSVTELERAVYDFTKETLLKLKERDLLPDMVQVGNEVTNGLLWPHGAEGCYDNIAKFLNAGIRAVREIVPDAPVMLHLDCGGNNARCRQWFDEYMQRGEAFDLIGLSYYPFWHGTIDDLTFNMNDLANRYDKDIVLVEVSMGYTMEDYVGYEKLAANERKGMATKPHLVENLEFPMTGEGQAAFMQTVMERIAQIPGGRGRGFYYWEPAWIPVPGCGWANEESLAYIEDKGPGGNEWANQALFDYEGNVLPALAVIRDFSLLPDNQK